LPADGAKLRAESITLSATVSDADSGPGDYRIIVYNENLTVFADTGWVATTGSINYVPPGLAYDKLYYWTLMVRDKVGNMTTADQRMFGTHPACVRTDPTVSLSTPTGTISTKIVTDAGSSVYNFKITNLDSLGCADNTFTLTAANNATTPEQIADKAKFNDPSLAPSVTIPPGSQSGTVSLTVSAKTANGADVSGVAYTTATVQDGGVHASRTTNQVLTILNVPGCTKGAPLLNIGPDNTYAARGGAAVYSVSVKNTDFGANCTSITYNLTKSDTNTSLFSSKIDNLDATSVTLLPGQAKVLTLKVTSTSAAINGSTNTTTVNVRSADYPVHPDPTPKTANTKIGDMMLHNSDNLGSAKWAGTGWGIPGGRYGEFTCATCHVEGGGDTRNTNRINEIIFTPDTSAHQHLPGEGKRVDFRRTSSTDPNQPTFGWDAGRNTAQLPLRICEGCHTDDLTGANGTKYHSQHTATDRASHFDGQDCIKCHKHKSGFGGGSCDSCHDYDASGSLWGFASPTNYGGFNEAIGKHALHINYLKSRWGNLTLNPSDGKVAGYGQGNNAKICGTCHTNNSGNHMTGNRVINFGENSDTTVFGTNTQYIRVVKGTAAFYNGSSSKNSASQPKTCSNLSCHYGTTPNW
jgi:hypothetical protein